MSSPTTPIPPMLKSVAAGRSTSTSSRSLQDAMRELCDAVASEFQLEPAAVRRLAALEKRISSNMNLAAQGENGEDEEEEEENETNKTEYVSVTNVVKLPEGKQLQDLTLDDLAKAIQDRREELARANKLRGATSEDVQEQDLLAAEGTTTEDSMKAVPFLLRFCLGEFHYGQRATKMLPGQKEMLGQMGTNNGNQANENYTGYGSSAASSPNNTPMGINTSSGGTTTAGGGQFPGGGAKNKNSTNDSSSLNPDAVIQQPSTSRVTTASTSELEKQESTTVQESEHSDTTVSTSAPSSATSTLGGANRGDNTKADVKTVLQQQVNHVDPAPATSNQEINTTATTTSSHSDAVSAAFDCLAREAKFSHLHQVAGWVDLDDKKIWDDYVIDTMQGKVLPGDRVFEAGCGVLAFLRSLQESVPGPVTIGGVDGAKKTIELVRSDLAPVEDRDNFSVGLLPDALTQFEENSWDVVVCNSVFQYLADKDQAKRAVDNMLRMARKWVIIADVLDAKYHDQSNARIAQMEWTKGVPEYRSYEKKWWEDNFDYIGSGNLVSIRHVECPHYARRKERYVVYIEKNAPVLVA
ncbi:unnamed protein product [Amoebophrya sp. A120]|nr:unnamed protein product [Amoebophrya sp. A120]|eukprot:GSA120T00001143001.1